MGRFKTIKGLSEQRRLPRLDYIRLGVKVKRSGDASCDCGSDDLCRKCSRPTETKHFVVPPEVAKVYGDTPTELDIVFPLDAVEDVFPQALKMYKAAGLWCEGNGEQALRRNEQGQWDEMACSCENLDARGGCKKVAVLNIILPRVNWGGVYQIVTSSFNSIIDVQSGIEYVRSLMGRVVMVGKKPPHHLKLLREPTATTHTDDKGQTRKQTHYTMKLRYMGTEEDINKERALTVEALRGPRYLIADEDRSARDMPTLIETSDPPVGQDGSEIVDMETGEVLNAERAKPGEGDDAKPAGKPDKSKKPRKPRKPKDKKDKKDKPAKPEKPAPAPTPAPPPRSEKSPDGEKPMSQVQVTTLWEWVQRAWGEGRLEDAKSFFGFFVKDYCAVSKSAQMPSKFYEMHVPTFKEIAEIGDAEKRGAAMASFVQRLQTAIAGRAPAPA